MSSKKKKAELYRSLTILGLLIFIACMFGVMTLYLVSATKKTQSIQSEAAANTGMSIVGQRGKKVVNKAAQASFTFQLQTGWNFVSPPVESPQLTADYVCGQAIGAVSVGNIVPGPNTVVEYYYCDRPSKAQKNFSLKANIAYFIQMAAPTSFAITGKPADDYAYNTIEGWNPFGFSLVYTDPNLTLPASNLCGDVTNTNLMVTEIDRFQLGGWDAHICGKPFNNFPVEAGRGYYLKAVNKLTGRQTIIAPLSTL